jgi:hypothetical protein
MAVSSREKAGQRATCPIQSLETHWRASAVLSIASSAAGTKRTRSCSPTALPSPRQADNSFSFFALLQKYWIQSPQPIASCYSLFLFVYFCCLFPCSCLFISVVYFPCSCLFISVVYFPCSCLFISLVCLFPLFLFVYFPCLFISLTSPYEPPATATPRFRSTPTPRSPFAMCQCYSTDTIKWIRANGYELQDTGYENL